MSDDELGFEPKSAAERRTLLAVLLLNVGLVAGLGASGVVGDSSGLIANALDNTSDVAVYAISYYAVGRAQLWKTRAAQLSGIVLFVLALVVLIDVGRRVVYGAEPASTIMMVMTVIAAAINLLCLKLLSSIRHGDVNLRAAWIFSVNDLLSNLGVLLAGVLVLALGQSWPDLVVGLVIALVVGKGGVEILLDARRTGRAEHSPR